MVMNLATRIEPIVPPMASIHVGAAPIASESRVTRSQPTPQCELPAELSLQVKTPAVHFETCTHLYSQLAGRVDRRAWRCGPRSRTMVFRSTSSTSPAKVLWEPRSPILRRGFVPVRGFNQAYHHSLLSLHCPEPVQKEDTMKQESSSRKRKRVAKSKERILTNGQQPLKGIIPGYRGTCAKTTG